MPHCYQVMPCSVHESWEIERQYERLKRPMQRGMWARGKHTLKAGLFSRLLWCIKSPRCKHMHSARHEMGAVTRALHNSACRGAHPS